MYRVCKGKLDTERFESEPVSTKNSVEEFPSYISNRFQFKHFSSIAQFYLQFLGFCAIYPTLLLGAFIQRVFCFVLSFLFHLSVHLFFVRVIRCGIETWKTRFLLRMLHPSGELQPSSCLSLCSAIWIEILDENLGKSPGDTWGISDCAQGILASSNQSSEIQKHLEDIKKKPRKMLHRWRIHKIMLRNVGDWVGFEWTLENLHALMRKEAQFCLTCRLWKDTRPSLQEAEEDTFPQIMILLVF